MLTRALLAATLGASLLLTPAAFGEAAPARDVPGAPLPDTGYEGPDTGTSGGVDTGGGAVPLPPDAGEVEPEPDSGAQTPDVPVPAQKDLGVGTPHDGGEAEDTGRPAPLPVARTSSCQTVAASEGTVWALVAVAVAGVMLRRGRR